MTDNVEIIENVKEGKKAVGVTAIPNDGYVFIGWYDNADFCGNPISIDNILIPVINKDETFSNTYFARFSEATVDMFSDEKGIDLIIKEDVTEKSKSNSIKYGVIAVLILIIALVLAVMFARSSEEAISSSNYIHVDHDEICIGETTEVVFVTEDYTYRNDEELLWRSNDETIATVSQFGIVTGISEGIVTITGEIEGIRKSVEITVVNNSIEEMSAQNVEQIKNLEIHCYTDTILIGDSVCAKLKADSWVIDGDSSGITWSSDKKNVASIERNGIIIANSVGKCNINAKYKEKNTTKEMNVVDVDGDSGITITSDYDSLSMSSYGEDKVILYLGGNISGPLGVTAYYSPGMNLKLTWGEFKDNSLQLIVKDIYSDSKQGYITVLAYDKDDNLHIVSSTKINVRIMNE